MSSQTCGVALPFVLQVGAFNWCNIGDIVVQIHTGVPRINVSSVLLVTESRTDNGVILVDGPGIDDGVLLVEGPRIDNSVLLIDGPGTNNGVPLVDGPTTDTVLSVVDSSTVFSMDANSS